MQRSKPRLFAAIVCPVLLAACGPDADVKVVSDDVMQAAVRSEFGEEAVVRRVLGDGETGVILGVAATPPEPDTDGIPQVALATYDDGVLSVIDRSETYREARPVGDALALLSDEGELIVRARDGGEITAPARVRGDLAPSRDGRLLAVTLEGETPEDGETAVATLDRSGEMSVVADAAGVDDRPALSPDGTTLVFVSGRSGVASLWKTTTVGGEPVQLTNHGIEAGVERDGDPEGFVPPPVNTDQLTWLDDATFRYDAGGGELWSINIHTRDARREGGAR